MIAANDHSKIIGSKAATAAEVNRVDGFIKLAWIKTTNLLTEDVTLHI